jgi:hypothetical protein
MLESVVQKVLVQVLECSMGVVGSQHTLAVLNIEPPGRENGGSLQRLTTIRFICWEECLYLT